jgi:hypothetical protein
MPKKSKRSDHNGGGRQRVVVPEGGSFLREFRERALPKQKPARADRDESGRFQPNQKSED